MVGAPRIGCGDKHVNVARYHFGKKGGHSVHIAVRPALLHEKVVASGPTQFAQPLPEVNLVAGGDTRLGDAGNEGQAHDSIRRRLAIDGSADADYEQQDNRSDKQTLSHRFTPHTLRRVSQASSVCAARLGDAQRDARNRLPSSERSVAAWESEFTRGLGVIAGSLGLNRRTSSNHLVGAQQNRLGDG